MNKLNVAALLLFLTAVVAVFTLKTPQTRAIQTWVMGVLSPFIRGGAQVEQQVQQVTASPRDVAALEDENRRLQQEVDKLSITARKYEEVLSENNKFRGMLEYRQQIDMKLTAARVLRRSSSNWWNTVIIDKGAMDGVGTDSAVITYVGQIGMVGKTGKVAAHTAEVILLTDEECRVAARIEGMQARGILMGERGGFETRPDLRLKFLDRTLKITPGAAVYSTGEGGVFPDNILLGKVKAFEIRDISGEAVVESAVDFSLLQDVFVVHKEAADTP
ncbi:rod shape-determining protein MreC [Roseimicrobium gellanilyticum]|uniref:Cell shape-determining protein MreC n=1 Tax=Roseimicrobium gellanilyticum TaxID=748857 RepID=A0A366HTJ0_9BACT|nr:rod shape-determining protein MreC [Roseimicrobium gellanilyticum]RBP46017.1 rod shape-determining protein MreC [Roseimicrobium gellanilyticum]